MKKNSFWQILNQFWQLNRVRGTPRVNSLGKSETKCLTMKEYNELIIRKNMEKKIFTNEVTTKEQYLKFKEFIKSDAEKDHSDYVAYYIFKHRIEGEERDKYLEDEIRHRCWKMLYSGRWGVSGGEMTESYVVPAFKNRVINTYNKYASTDGKE